jgi:transposase-like protein
MDITAEAEVPTDSLGRRTGPRRQHTIEEKRRIVEETHVRGASVSRVARRHEVNPNQVFAWRQQYRQGLLDVNCSQATAPMLAVKVSTPTVLPGEPEVERVPPKGVPAERLGGWIEIELSNGQCVRVHGVVDAKALSRGIDVLVRR